MWSLALPPVVALIIELALPCYLAYDMWRGTRETRWGWWLHAAASTTFLVLLFVTGRWDLVGYHLRPLLAALFIVAAGAGYIGTRSLPWSAHEGLRAATPLISSAVSLLLFAGLLGYAVRGYWYDDVPVRLSLPLRGDAFYVAQGGNSPLINYHNSHATQRYAMDILQLNDIGVRAASPFTADLDRYVIFGQPVSSPCDGRIVSAADDLEDNVPPHRDRENPTGNQVVVACHGVRVFLAHLQRGSVSVQPGAPVASGDLVGRVGNSGNSSEPHLHIHAVREDTPDNVGTAVPILFDGTFPVRNTILRRAMVARRHSASAPRRLATPSRIGAVHRRRRTPADSTDAHLTTPWRETRWPPVRAYASRDRRVP